MKNLVPIDMLPILTDARCLSAMYLDLVKDLFSRFATIEYGHVARQAHNKLAEMGLDGDECPSEFLGEDGRPDPSAIPSISYAVNLEQPAKHAIEFANALLRVLGESVDETVKEKKRIDRVARKASDRLDARQREREERISRRRSRSEKLRDLESIDERDDQEFGNGDSQ